MVVNRIGTDGVGAPRLFVADVRLEVQIFDIQPGTGSRALDRFRVAMKPKSGTPGH